MVLDIPALKWNVIGVETDAATIHECAALCNLKTYGGVQCEMFIPDTVAKTCTMGNIATTVPDPAPEGTTSVYVKRSKFCSASIEQKGCIKYDLWF